MSVVTVHLLRHGEHGHFGHTLTGSTIGVGLSAHGQEQAARVAAAYAGAAIRTVLSSPLQRAVETAAPVAAALGLQPVMDVALEEIDFGAWAGQRFDALVSAPGWAGWNSARSLAPTPGGETMLAVQARAVATLVRQRMLGGTVVAVSHSDVIKAVLAYVLGMPLDLLHRLEVGPASRSVVVLGETFARVDAINLPP